uniref:Cytochrome c oxidase subunit 3 n=1 Tax=Achatinella sowerbyana TaxID=115944 RepID=A0A343A157_9EUPU|nr:cytochrome c oxidase subunit 3 [Achatinella sowerbyana]
MFFILYKTPFHLVQYSPWPLLISFSILGLPMGFIFNLKMHTNIITFMNMMLVSLIAYFWWRDITRESTYQGFHTTYVAKGLKIGMLLFILSEVCFFFGIFWAYFHMALAPSFEIGSTWPPVGVIPLNPFQVPLLNTAVLLLSGVSITWAHYSLEKSKYMNTMYALLFTVILGLYFLYLQYTEYTETSFTFADSVYGSTFFLSTGFHGLHVAIGATFLLTCLIRHIKYHFSSTHHVGFLAAAWYWHFVDVVWLFLYVTIYWWGG